MNDQNLPEISAPEDDEVSLLDLATALGEEKQTLFGIPAVTTTLAIVYALMATPIYTAKVSIAQQQQQQQLQAILESQTLRASLIHSMQLQAHYKTETQTQTIEALTAASKVSVDKKTGLIHLEVDDQSPQFAATLANAHVTVLQQQLAALAIADTQARRKFYIDLISQLQSHPEDGHEIGVQARGRLIEELRAKEVEFSSLRQSASETGATLHRRIREINILNERLDALEAVLSTNTTLNQTTQNQKLTVILKQQEELTRLDEFRTPPRIQIMDHAQAPEKKTKPKGAQIVILAGVAGLFLGVLLAFVRRALRKASENPDSAGKMAGLKRAWTTGWSLKR